MGKVKRTFNIDDKVEEKLNEMGKKGMSRSFFANQALREKIERENEGNRKRLKKLGLL